MPPKKPTAGSSGDPATGDTSYPEVDDAKRALHRASARNSSMRRRQDKKDKQAGLEAAKVADTASRDDGVNLLLDGINSLAHSLPPLVKALDAVAQIHPFIAIAVGAFKVVIELEIKRRDNDKKVNLLFLEMKNMMSVLLQLQSVRANHVARDGKTIRARLVDLVKRTANDIKECANVCDTYSKKRLLVKVLKGPMWDDTLKKFIKLFADRKVDFSFAVSMHTGMAIDSANDKLDALMTTMELIMEFFERCVPPSHATFNEIVKRAGGLDVAIQNRYLLSILIKCERSFEHPPSIVADYSIPETSTYLPPIVPLDHMPGIAEIADSGFHQQFPGYSGLDYSHTAESQGWHRRMFRSYASGAESDSEWVTPDYLQVGGKSAYPYQKTYLPAVPSERFTDSEHEVLRQELSQAPSDDIKKNLEVFEGKFEMQSRVLAQEMKRFVAHEGDRVIRAMLAGPHEKIIDPDLYEVWKDMRWRGIVKARHLVLAICDYYLQKQEVHEHALKFDGNRPKTQKYQSVPEDDVWTLQYIDLMHVQPVIEALDFDTSGYVTIQEVNQFTTSRPKGWSLLHWMAYWAVGWQVCMTAYRGKILFILDSITSLLKNVLTPNRAQAREYIDITRHLVTNMVYPFREDADRLFLLPQFQAYMDENQARLQKSLETVRYEIDALDTLALINGPGGLERNVFPLLYLLLSRHCDIMKLGRIHVLHEDELADAQQSINIIHGAFQLRRNQLHELFRQQRLWVAEELVYFAHGMFSFLGYYTDTSESRTRRGDEEDTYNPNEDLPSTSILKYPPLGKNLHPINEDASDVSDDEIGEEIGDEQGLRGGLGCTRQFRASWRGCICL